MRFSAIDIGTVTSRLLVADVDESGRLTPVIRRYEVTNLGERVDSTGELSKEAISRTTSAIMSFLESEASVDTEENPIVSRRVVSTSAARDAKNSSEFISSLEKLGVNLDIIEGTQEATLSFLGATYNLREVREDASIKHALVVDVGGGSTEFSLGEITEIESTPSSISLNIGCRRMTERFLKSNPILPEEIEAARKWTSENIALGIKAIFTKNFSNAKFKVIAVAGTATSCVTMLKEMTDYIAEEVDGAKVPLDELQLLTQKLAAMTLQERMHVVGLDPKRAPVVVAGQIILEETLKTLYRDCFYASDSDILQGIILSQYRNATF